MSHSPSDARAAAKAIGEDVELLVAQLIEGVELVPDDVVDWHDAIVTEQVQPPQHGIIFGGVCLLWRGAPVEIKACKTQVSNGDRDPRSGMWLFKGRDGGQHAHLVEANGIYALAVHREAEGYLGREAAGVIVVPAVTVDDHLEGRWYDSNRREGMVAQLSWTALLDEADLRDGGEA